MKKRNTRFIPYSRQSITADDIKAVVQTLKSDFITQGSKVGEFEQAVARYVGVRYAVAVNSGTSALLVACSAAGISAGDEVITTPYTFCASANCFVWFGAKPVFVDIDRKTLNINPSQIERAITKKTKAIIAVDFAGLPCDYDAITNIAKKHNLVLIDDACHAFGAEYKNKKIGSIADITCFSFHPVKSITTGEGGVLVTNNRQFYGKAKNFRNHGINKDKKKSDMPWFYEMETLGLNLRITDIQAALGISQLKKINKFIAKRRSIAKKYNKAFVNMPFEQPWEDSDLKSSWHLYPIKLDFSKLKANRQEIFNALRRNGLGVQVHYIPIHLHPYYESRFNYKKGDFPCAEEIYSSEISLPLYPKMTESDINYVIKTLKNVCGKYQK